MVRKLVVCFAASALVATSLLGQAPATSGGWVKGIVAHGVTASVTPRGIAALPDGSTVVLTVINGGVTFGTGEAGEVLLAAPASQPAVARYDAAGSVQWARRFSVSHSSTFAIAATPDGSSFVTGTFAGTTATAGVFGLGEANETILPNDGIRDLYIAKFNADGTFARVSLGISSSAAGLAEGLAIAALPDGSCYVTGLFRGTLTFGIGTPNQVALTWTGGTFNDAFLARFNADGSFAWARHAGGVGTHDIGRGVVALPDGSAVFTGEFSNPITFSIGTPAPFLLSGGTGEGEAFMARYGPTGDLMWARRVGVPDGDVVPAGIAGTPDSIFVAGSMIGSVVFGAGETNETTLSSPNDAVFLARYNHAGNLVWARQTVNGPPAAAESGARAVSALPDGSSFITGSIEIAVSFGGGTITPTSGEDAFVARYHPDGSVQWVRVSRSIHTPGTAFDSDWGAGIAALPGGASVTAMRVSAPAIFGDGLIGQTLDGFGENAAAVVKYNAEGSFAVLNAPPQANAGADQVVECTQHGGTPVTFNGAGSSDPDEDALAYTWSGPFGTATGVSPTRLLPLGTHTITLMVADPDGETSSDSMTVVVEDTTPPAIAAPASGSYPLGAGIQLGSATATDMCDPDPVVTSNAPSTFGLGPTVVTWTATDASGNTATATQTVTVFSMTGLGTDVVVGPGVTFGSGVKLKDGVQVGANVTFGADVEVKENAVVGAGSTLGADVKVQEGAIIGMGVEIGAGSTIKEGATVGDGSRIGRHVTIKAGASVGANVKIGLNAVIGPEAVVGYGAEIGDEAKVKEQAQVGAEARVGRDARIAPAVTVGAGASIGDDEHVQTNVAAGGVVGGTPTPPTLD